jgi:hypothetical protein
VLANKTLDPTPSPLEALKTSKTREDFATDRLD